MQPRGHGAQERAFAHPTDCRRGDRMSSISPPLADAPEAAPSPAIRSRLFRKYAALFVDVVSLALLADGVLEIWFSYREHKALLIRSQHDQAVAAAGKIGQFIDEVQSHIGWMTLMPWSADMLEQQYLDALRLLRQAPAISELAQLDA